MSTKTPEELSEIQNLPIAELTELLAGLDVDDLKALRALEDKSSTKRKGALDAIDAAIQAAADKAAADKAAADKAAADKAAADKAAADKAGAGGESTPAAAATPAADEVEKPAWQAADYSGPLTIPQADWRRVNLKPVTGVATK